MSLLGITVFVRYLAFRPQDNLPLGRAVPTRNCTWGSRRIPLRLPRLQLDHFAVHCELAISVMVDGLRVLLHRISPGFDDFQYEEVELADETGIDHLAFKVGEAFGHQRRRHTLGWRRRQAESLELVHVPSRAIANTHDLGCQFNRWNGDNALSHRSQRSEAVIGVADDTGDQRRLELYHHVPGHRHDVGSALVGGRQEDHWTRFKQLVDP